MPDIDDVPGAAARDDLDPFGTILADAAAGLDARATGLLLRIGGELAWLGSAGLGADATEGYLGHWHRLDPWLAALGTAVPGRVVRGEALVGARLLRGSAFHAGWLLPNGLGSAAFADIAPGPGQEAWLCAYFAAGRRPASPTELRLLRAVAGALALALPGAGLAHGARAAAGLLVRAPVPLLVLRPDCTLIWANDAGGALCATDGPLRRAGPRIYPRLAEQAEPFQRGVAAAANPPGRISLMRLPGPQGARAARLQPLPGAARGTAAAALIVSPEAPSPPEAATLGAALGLTRSHAEIAALLCRGLDSAAMADRLGLSQHTLNGYLARLYDRLGVSNRVQAVVRLLASSAALSLLSMPPDAADSASGHNRIV